MEGVVFVEIGFLGIVLIFLVGGVCFCCSTLGYCVAGGVKGAYDDLANLAVSQAPSPQHTVSPAVEPTTEEGDEEAAQDEQDENDETEPLVTEHQDVQYHLMTDSPPPSRSRTASRHMNCLVTACTVCYVLSLVGIGLFVFGSMRYFPKVPQYNVCNDAVAWKSLVDSMTSVKMEASFEILVSIMNPNHFDVALPISKATSK